MGVVVYSVVRRYMTHTSPGTFTRFDGSQELPVKISLTPGDAIVGWYRNPPPWERYFVVFTQEAIYVVDDERVERIAVTDIVGYESPKSKTDITGLRVLTRDGFRFVRISGSFGPGGSHKDAFSFFSVIRAIAHGNRVSRTDDGAPDDEADGS